ncbi:nuclease-related domain-containing protein [Cytobacillus sp. NJ13]|nr:nuclease-related domain-containing protein [Cytobacillus sp. NJ13]
MILKPRNETEELNLLRCLNRKMRLHSKDYSHFLNLEKGLTGEKLFDERLGELPDEWIIINDLLLEYRNTIFQIDSLLITGDCVYIFEVKNYDGDYYIEQDRWYTASNNEVKNPLLQLQRSESLLRRLLQELGCKSPLKALLIFINPEFHLYHSTINFPAIFPAQINRFMDKLKMKSQPPNKIHFKLAETLMSLHLEKTSFDRRPEYTYEGLEKGISCLSCKTFLAPLNKLNMICPKCGIIEDITHAVTRSVDEYKLLFPEQKITTASIQEWCKTIHSKKTIRRALVNNFDLINTGRSTHYK